MNDHDLDHPTPFSDKLKGRRIFFAAAGGGSSIMTATSQRGASKYLVGGEYLYSRKSVDDFLGFKPASYCSAESAADLAIQAFIRACEGDCSTNAVGVGTTAVLGTDPMPMGGCRAFVCMISSESVSMSEINFPFSERTGWPIPSTREDQESHIKTLVSTILANDFDWSEGGSKETKSLVIKRLMAHPRFNIDGRKGDGEGPNWRREVFFPATLNPLHEGHESVCAEVFNDVGKPPVFMVELNPPHKPELQVQDCLRKVLMAKRIAMSILFTEGTPLFIDKSRRWKRTTFVIGTDAMASMLNPKWGYDIPKLLLEMRANHTDFLVASRHIDGKFVSMCDVKLPRGFDYYPMFKRLDNDPIDISSTEVRGRDV